MVRIVSCVNVNSKFIGITTFYRSFLVQVIFELEFRCFFDALDVELIIQHYIRSGVQYENFLFPVIVHDYGNICRNL